MTGFAGVGRVLVVCPTYDEAATLPGVARRLRAAVPEADLLVVDDASPDGTGAVADALAAADPQIAVLHRRGKSGLGRAYVAGFAWAAERAYEAVVEMDADGSHAPEELPRLLTALRRADVVLGSRWVPGGAVRDWPVRRRLLSRGGNAYTRRMLRLPLTDATGGFRAYRAAALARLPLHSVASHGYCFQVDLAWAAWREGLAVVEVPITFSERTEGSSKMSWPIVGEALWRVTAWGVSRRWAKAASPGAETPRAATPRAATPWAGAPRAGPGRELGAPTAGPPAAETIPTSGG
jgi:dolichol-phosphate mannosyltransferase